MMTNKLSIYFKVVKSEDETLYGSISLGKELNDSNFADMEFKSKTEESIKSKVAEALAVSSSRIIIISKEEYLNCAYDPNEEDSSEEEEDYYDPDEYDDGYDDADGYDPDECGDGY